MTHFNMHHAKTELSRLVRRAEAGEEIIICRAGKPIVRLEVLKRKPEPAKPRRSEDYKKYYESRPPDSDDPHAYMEIFE